MVELATLSWNSSEPLIIIRKHTRRLLGVTWLSFVSFALITTHHLAATEIFMKPYEARRSWSPTAGKADGFRQSWLPGTGQARALLRPMIASGQGGGGQGYRSNLVWCCYCISGETELQEGEGISQQISLWPEWESVLPDPSDRVVFACWFWVTGIW